MPPTKIYAKQTSNMGLGVFASEKIIKGESIVVNYCIEIKDEEYPKPKNKPLIFYDYAFMCPRTKKNNSDKSYRVVALGFGSVINHSSKPNASWKNGKEEWTLEWYAIKDIEKDDQILSNYGEQYSKYIEKQKKIKFI